MINRESVNNSVRALNESKDIMILALRNLELAGYINPVVHGAIYSSVRNIKDCMNIINMKG